jgi:aminopeptidase N
MRRAGWVLVVGLVLGSATGIGAQSPVGKRYDAERVAHDAEHYDVWIRLADSGSRFEAKVTTRWKLSGAAPIRINLDSTYRIRALTLDGRAANYRRQDAGLLLVTLPSGASGTATTVIEYEGSPPKFVRPGWKSGQDDGLVQTGSGASRRIFADNWPNRARKWLAAQDHPSDKATVAWTIDAPTGLTVVANGALIGSEPTDGGLTRWRFTTEQPIPVYTMVLGAARLAVTKLAPAACSVRCVPVSVYTYPEDSAWAVSGPFRRGSEMIDYFAGIIGPYPYAELRHVQTSTIFGGMENSTVIFYDESAYRSKQLGEGTVAHETVHQWFGDAATEADWHHLWLSEGFATYFANLWIGHAGGDSAFSSAMAANKQAVIQSAATERPIIDPAATDLLGLLNSNNYPKGAWVLHSLRGLVGDSAFFRGLRAYYREHQHGTALSSDLARIMERESGQQLDWYFSQALTQPGYPIVEVKTELEGGHLVVTLTQVQKPAWGTFKLPNLEIMLGGRTIAIPLVGPSARTVTHWEGSDPPTVVVDPRGWWLMEAKTAR